MRPPGAPDLRAGRTGVAGPADGPDGGRGGLALPALRRVRRLGALVINLLLVIYLVWSKRLFGVGGGQAAHESRLRGESFIEVEQAALAEAPRAGADMPQ